MDAIAQFLQKLTGAERALMDSLNSPAKIQAFLDSDVPYSTEDTDRCPLRVLREQVAHCLEGAWFAAAALRLIGYPPLVLQMLPCDQDDDHMVAVFKAFGCWGAIGKSNYVGLRYREPVYRDVRELVMSYFEDFFNSYGERTLLGYRRPMNLAVYDRLGWMWRDEAIAVWIRHLAQRPAIRVVTPAQQAFLSRVDDRSLQAGVLGANPAGLFAPGGYKPEYTRFPGK